MEIPHIVVELRQRCEAVAYDRVVGSEITGWEMACGMQAGAVRPAWVQVRVRSWR
ncbi:hypothetical protein ACFYYH_13275 [Streptomyces sp. NPDC002018]|uniref:hypothetical protein n=1 Tax=Streptomyces sp. NPDC002018 TaxID=3364629 RepID=UPI0036808C6E